jgi:polyisoprenoid-binding protein YceI
MNATVLTTVLRGSCKLLILGLLTSAAAAAQDLVLQLDPTRTTIKFTLGAALHTIHGSFEPKAGVLHTNPASGKLSGEIVVDAKSGQSGNAMRDRKMHKEVLESEKYAEIRFRPCQIEGTVAPEGKSSLRLRGIFSVHGTDHDITVPAEVEMSADHWSANVHFTIPYAKWGIKNPSTFFLHVSDEVEIEVSMAGTLTTETSTIHAGQ